MPSEGRELTELLTKLYTLQEDVGAKPQTTAEDKTNRASNAAMLGKGRQGKKSGTRFLELKTSIITRLRTVHELLDAEAKRTQGQLSVAEASNPTDVIKQKSLVREELRQAEGEWKEMEGLYKAEARKKRSKFTKEQLDIQQTLVQRLNAEIEKAKEIQAKPFARRDSGAVAAKMNVQALVSLSNMDLDDTAGDFGPNRGGDESNWSGGQGPGVELTETQSLQIQQIENRDQEFDKELDTIGEGIKDLGEIAAMQSEEVKRQNVMLENVEKRIEDAVEHVTTVNQRTKETLNEVQASDNIRVDIVCIVMMVGLGDVLYTVASG